MNEGVAKVEEDVTQLAWGTGLVDALNEFLGRIRLDGLEVAQIVVLNGRHLAITTTYAQTVEDIGLYHYDRHYRETQR
jgi:hypothetical protein